MTLAPIIPIRARLRFGRGEGNPDTETPVQVVMPADGKGKEKRPRRWIVFPAAMAPSAAVVPVEAPGPRGGRKRWLLLGLGLGLVPFGAGVFWLVRGAVRGDSRPALVSRVFRTGPSSSVTLDWAEYEEAHGHPPAGVAAWEFESIPYDPRVAAPAGAPTPMDFEEAAALVRERAERAGYAGKIRVRP